MTSPYSLRLLGALGALAAASGCSNLDNCPEDQSDPITVSTGLSDAKTLVFESAPWEGPLDEFPAKTKLSFEHDLGFTPLTVKAYLSFSRWGTKGMRGSVAESAGNQDLITCVDSQVIVLKNDTCERDFFVRVTAEDRVLTEPELPCSDE